jgi:hypothetical protein
MFWTAGAPKVAVEFKRPGRNRMIVALKARGSSRMIWALMVRRASGSRLVSVAGQR